MRYTISAKVNAIWKIVCSKPVVYGVAFRCLPDEVPMDFTYFYTCSFSKKITETL